MRPIVLATAVLLVLSGCAAAEPEVSSQVQSSQDAQATEAQATEEPTEASSVEASESSEPESAQQEVVESDGEASAEPEPDTTVEAQATSTSEPRPTQTQEPESEPSQEPTGEATEEPASEPEIVGYTLAEVAQRDTASDCWVAIDGGVFDLTMWISRHPGGAGAITQLCGTDGTQQFLGMHAGQSRPASTLDGYYIGPLR